LKVTLKNGDVVYYDLDPTTYLEIRTETQQSETQQSETQQFIRGSMRASPSWARTSWSTACTPNP
jgi:hypothetical protein